jgi:crotonobetainyl-CoA:carnitine CoA-transferase CaiB-like acyl-CoA transferase
MRHSAHPSLVPFQAFEASDGWLVVGCAKEKFWRRLVDVLGRPDLAADPRFADFASRQQHADVLLPALERIFLTRTVAEWLEPMRVAGIPSGPINDVAQALREEHTAARGLVVQTSHPRWGTVRQVASPARVGDGPAAYRRAPLRGEHLDEVADLLGYDSRRVGELAAAGAFGSPDASSPAPEPGPGEADRADAAGPAR